MRLLIGVFSLSVLLLSGCAMFTEPKPGMSEAQLIELRGKPDAIYQEGNVSLWEWSVSVNGQHAYIAKVGPDKKVISYEQVLTKEKFASIIINRFTKQDVLKTVGHPSETEYLPLIDKEVWSYRYKEDGLFNSMMHIYFDHSGIVRRLENGLDPMYMRV